MKEGGQPEFHDPTDLFSALFGFPTHSAPQKGEDIIHHMKMSLEDLYQGKTKKLRITASKVCPRCNGKGAVNPSAVKQCEMCGGKGIRTVTQQMGPGFISTSRQPCRFCRQRGVIIDPKDQCPECHAENTITKEKEIEVFVEKGMRSGQKITFPQEGNEEPGIEAGDLVIVIDEKPHPTFTRRGNDLLITKKISFAESLCGCSFEVETLDKRHLLIKTEEGDIIKPGDTRKIVGEGMPVYRSDLSKGDLVVTFQVEYPEKGSINPTMRKNLLSIFPLPAPPQPQPGVDVEEVELQDPSTTTEDGASGYGAGRRPQGFYRQGPMGPQHTSTSATGMDDDDDQGQYGPQAQTVQCGTQ